MVALSARSLAMIRSMACSGPDFFEPPANTGIDASSVTNVRMEIRFIVRLLTKSPDTEKQLATSRLRNEFRAGIRDHTESEAGSPSGGMGGSPSPTQSRKDT